MKAPTISLVTPCLLLHYSPSPDAVGTPVTTVRTLNSLLGLADRRVLARAEGLNTGQAGVAVAALGSGSLLANEVVPELATGRLDDATAVRLCVVRGAGREGDSLRHLCG